MRRVVVVLAIAGCSHPTAAPSCALADLPRLHWPLDGRDWFVTAYLDADPGPRTRDFMGNTGPDAITYDGHDGIDIALARGFEQMDAGVTVHASLDGVVKEAVDGEPDRNEGTAPGVEAPLANHVIVVAPNGFTVVYWHLRKGSVAVRAGQHVATGQKLGEVGSSGISRGPHLHVGAYDCTGKAVDLMAAGAFVDAPPYHPPQRLLYAHYALAEHGPPATSVSVGQTIYADLMFAEMRAGETVRLDITPPGGEPRPGSAGTGDHFLPGFFWRPSFRVDTAGTWTFTVKIGNDVVDQRTLSVDGG